jgi:glycosyltransferase involved in cell wall biosynthesis
MTRVAVVVKGYPRLSETFIAQEILGLERRGLDVLIVSLRRPTDKAVHPVHREIRAEVLYLPEYLKDDPPRVAAARRTAARLPGFAAAQAAYERDLARDRSASRRRRFGQACVLAAELPADVDALYVHFLHTPASVTRYAATMRGLPWSFSAHAKDIWTTPDWELAEKIADAAWGTTCTAVNAAKLRDLADRPEKVALVHHGLDFARFPAPPGRPAERDGRTAPVTILSVARAVDKKGLDDVLRALARLPAELDWRFVHIGGGSLVPQLAALAERLGIAGRVAWRGAQPQAAVIEACAAADLFVLASRVTRDGDRDGLPNVLMEAQALGLACVSTRVSAIPEVIEDGVTGLLVEPRDPAGLATALAALIRDPARRAALGTAAAREVRARFSAEPGLDRIAALVRGGRPAAAA